MKNKKRKNLSSLIGIIGLGVLVLALAVSVILQNVSVPVGDAYFIFAGTNEDADCSIFISDGSCVVIDTGVETDGDHIVSLLKEQGLSEIEYLILTHPDKDHIGSALKLLDEFTTVNLITPYYGQFNADYSEILKKAEEKGINHQVITEMGSLRAGDLKLTVYPPEESFYEDDNEYSLVVHVNHGNVNLLMTGDIERLRIAEIEDISFKDISLMKIPYHGRSSNASADFIRRINPKFAIVNAAAPESKIEKAMNKLGIEYYCTVGYDVTFTSDGDILGFLEQEALS